MTLLAPDATSDANAAPPAPRTTTSYPGWAFVLMMAGYPLAWAIGLGPAMWFIAAWPMLLWLLANRPVQVPDGFILWITFLVVVGASVVQVNSAGRMATYGLRTGWYLCATLTLLYLLNQPRQRTVKVVIGSLIALWFAVVAIGYAALLMPNLAWSTPVIKALPGILADNAFIKDLLNPRLAEVQVFGDLVLGRPAGPFPYTNSWGSTFALLTPFVFAGIHDKKLGMPRPLLVAALFFSLPPFIAALNRGAWLTLGLGIVYGLLSYARKTGKTGIVKGFALLVVLGIAAAILSGLVGTVSNQLNTRSEDSNEARLSIYEETYKAVKQSPLLGYGTPRENLALPETAPLGTHGQFWMVLYSHGFLAAVFFMLFFIQAFFRYRARSITTLWVKVAMFIGLVQLPIYGHLPQQLFIMMAAIAVLAISTKIDSSEQVELVRI